MDRWMQNWPVDRMRLSPGSAEPCLSVWGEGSQAEQSRAGQVSGVSRLTSGDGGGDVDLGDSERCKQKGSWSEPPGWD